MEQELLKNNFERHGFKTSFFDIKEAAAGLSERSDFREKSCDRRKRNGTGDGTL